MPDSADRRAPEARIDRRIEMTERWLNSKAVQPSEGDRLEFVDRRTQGLVLRVSRHGDETLKLWMVRYRPKGGAQRRVAIGEYGPSPRLTLEAARQRARKIIAAAGDGVDLPAREAEDRLKVQGEAEARRKRAEQPQTVAHLLDLYVEDYCKANQRRWRLVERMFENHVKPTSLGRKSLADVRRADVIEVLDNLQNKKRFGAQVNRVRSQLLAAFNWAVEREKTDVNPAAGIKRRKIEARRSRVLSDDELQAIWRAASGLSDPSGSLVKSWALSAQRRDEVRCLPRPEIDENRAVWLLPAARNKSKRDHLIPLAPALVVLLGNLPRLGIPVFTVDGTKPYGGQKRLKEILDRESGVKDWTFHDFRRTAASGMASLGVPQDIIDRVLNHAKSTLAGTYNVYEYLDEKRRALEAWAEHVAFVIGDRSEPAVKYPERSDKAGLGHDRRPPRDSKHMRDAVELTERRARG
jgi:integrase